MKYFPKKLSIAWIEKRYESGELSPLELANEIIRRAKEYEDYNIWIVKPSMDMMKQYIDALPPYTKELPLWGIPFAVKDNIDLKDVPTTAACKEYEYIPKTSATVVDKLISAGAIPVGKTNLDQFATGLVGTRSPYGECHNALNPELISGGSSSGSAVAVALGMAAFSLGTDTAGSGRVPAALNCLIGYKPALGAWSTKGVVPACASIDCVSVFTNTLEDVILVNSLVREFDEDCSWSRRLPRIIPVKPRKILLPSEGPIFFGKFAKIYKEKWENAINRIKRLGIPVEYIDYTIFEKAASILYEGPWVAERWKDLGKFIHNNPGKTFPVTEEILRAGEKREYTAAKLFEAIHTLQDYRVKADKILQDSVLIMPTVGGTFYRDEVRENPIETNKMMGLYTNHCNLLDLSAIAIPEKQDDNDIPFGITIFALADSEGLVLKTADTFLHSETIPIAVCGLHKKGYLLENQLTVQGAVFTEKAKTTDKYKLYKLNSTPVKPGMVRDEKNGTYIEVDVYDIPVANLGIFMKQVTSPLSIGEIELEDGRWVNGFICEPYGVENAEDISDSHSF
ncbi:allophanate hydrolase [Lachnospiraceae bacterium MD1]|jgi:allophanate hydrolase|uniref:Allophanate hydrolase n=1 Tax=Variimorphobacter saccharofermentans TaxID=2755051 RepID=A0A839K1J2_9FIRM|nr:allophanate hydrolase [Variimorphobacter saccharofermentans]MBB2183287.1 allophanate hydrolase [Variimorphobacter saccharofermentans]